MQRKLSVRTRVFLGIGACAVILVVWQALAPPPPATTELTQPLDGTRPPDDVPRPEGVTSPEGQELAPDAQQPQQWVQFGGYEFPRQYVLMALSLFVPLLVGAVVLTILVLRRRTISCPACHKSFPRSAPICTHCGRDPRAS